MKAIIKYFSDVLGGMYTLWQGMSITGKHFVRAPKEIITQEYPDNRDTLKMMDRYRGQVIMPHNENNEHRCTGCQACEMACPNGSIEIVWKRDIDERTGKKKKMIDKHIYHLSMCTMCNLCILACPTDAIEMGKDFEYAVYDRSELTKVLNKPGSRLVEQL